MLRRLLRLPRPEQAIESLPDFARQQSFAAHAAFKLAADDVLHGACRVLLHDIGDELAEIERFVEAALNRELQRLALQRSEQPLAAAKQTFRQRHAGEQVEFFRLHVDASLRDDRQVANHDLQPAVIDDFVLHLERHILLRQREQRDVLICVSARSTASDQRIKLAGQADELLSGLARADLPIESPASRQCPR